MYRYHTIVRKTLTKKNLRKTDNNMEAVSTFKNDIVVQK